MTSTTRTTVLRKANKVELAALKEAAQAKFYNSQHGYDAFAFTDPKSGRAIAGHVEGAYIPVLVVQATDILKVYREKLGEGYRPHPLDIIPYMGQSVNLYFYRPQVDLDASLEAIYQKVTDEYHAEIAAENEVIIEREVQLQVANAARLKAEQLAAETQAETERVRQEVETALGATRQAVRDSMGVK